MVNETKVRQRLLVCFLIFFTGVGSSASSFHGKAKIQSIEYKAAGQLIIQFETLNNQDFGTLPANIKKFKFDYLNWPKKSRFRTWWYKLLNGNPEDSTSYSKEDFEDCINWMIKSFQSGNSFQIGQTGGGTFEVSENAQDEVVIPYIRPGNIIETKEKICMVDLG